MRAKDIIQSLNILIEEQLPVFLWGSPGIGKSSIVKQIAKDQNIAFIDLRLALLDPTDLKGIPFLDQEHKQAIWASPSFLPKDGKGILFLDELNSAVPAVQASAYQLILDRAVGEYKLPDGWAIVAAGNKESDRGVVYKMPSPLANRFVHLEMEVNIQDWILWAYRSNIKEEIIAYLQYKPEKLFTFEPKENKKAFATPRSWSYIDKILKSKIHKNLLNDLVGGAIGKEEAIDFLSFRKVMYKLPNINDILEAKEVTLNSDPQVNYVLNSTLVAQLIQNSSLDRKNAIIKYALLISSEFSVMLIQDLQRQEIDLEESPLWSNWVEKFAYLLA